ncbi:GAF domain-containing protein [Chloroflexus sp.]|uniref:GAF domain-containing protein n=1 Tax=Chloroflexus sp. TaxID=1904827 RepID=UPI002ADD5844|nr:GAF domain-containing protein [Chloroflexus sp.]
MSESAHILIVEDDNDIRRIFQVILTRHGFRVSVATTGEEALNFLQLITPDLILLDLALPGIDGAEITRRIKADRTKPFIPIIIVSAHADLNTSVSNLDAGADDVLLKPVDHTLLLARVRALLRLQRAQRNLQQEQRKTELLLHLSRDLGSSIELDVLLTGFLNHLADAIGAIRASIILTGFIEEKVLLYSSSQYSASGEIQDILRYGVAGLALRSRKPILITDTRTDSRWLVTSERHQDVRSVAAMPIIRDNRAWGVITLVHHTPGYFTNEHLELLSSVAAQSAVALESARLYRLSEQQKDLLARRAEELRQINEINRMLSELMQMDQLSRLLVQMIHHQFKYPLVALLLRQDNQFELRAIAGVNLLGETKVVIGLDEGLSGWVYRQQQPLRIDDLRQDGRFVPLLPGEALARSALSIPVLLGHELLGTIEVRSQQPGAFTSNDEAILQAIANQLAIAISNARLFESEQRRIRQLNDINRLSLALTAQLTAATDMQLIAKAVTQIFQAKWTAIILFGPKPTDTIVASYGQDASFNQELSRLLERNPYIAAKIMMVPQPCYVTDLVERADLASLQSLFTAQALDSLLLAPLTVKKQTQGFLCLEVNRRAQFGQAEQELLTTVASLVVQIIENARLYRIVNDERSTLNAILQSATDPILLIDPQARLLLANSAAFSRLQIDQKTHYGQPVEQFPAIHAILPVLDKERSTILEIELRPHLHFSISIAPVRGVDRKMLGWVVVFRDISPIKRLEQQERERVRSVFRRYVSPEVAERLLSAGSDFGAPTECTVAVLFADMRGFTTLSEQLDAHVLVERVLNRFFTAMTDALYAYDGTIDKFLGDGLIGVFGSPISHPDDPQRVVMAAVAMQQAFARLAQIWREELIFDIGMGIGISYGLAVVGNIGSDQRQDYTLIGDVVNTASRLCSIAQAGQIIISSHLMQALGDQSPYELRELGAVRLKGKQEPHVIYEVLFDQSLVKVEK